MISTYLQSFFVDAFIINEEFSFNPINSAAKFIHVYTIMVANIGYILDPIENT